MPMRSALEAGGEVGRDLLAVPWETTPLGPPEQWPHSLQNAVRILLTSKFSMWMAWGPELTFFCNEAYRRDTLGKKYPWALGKPASVVWSEIWSDIGPRIDRVMGTGEATWDEQLMLFLERSGFVEETYHTFSYSPLADDDGRISGMLCVVSEDTEQVINARRMGTLRDLGSGTTAELSEAETIGSACQQLAANPRSLPFTLIYLYDDSGQTATLAGSSGVEAGHAAAPQRLTADDPDAVWPVAALTEGDTVEVTDLSQRFADLPHGAWDVPPMAAIVAPLLQPTQQSPYGFIVAGLNPFRPLDDSYRSFVRLVAGQIAAAITDARAYEFERRRAESLARIDQAKTDFFTNVSHEFRTPLTLLLGPTVDALADEQEPLPPGQRHRVEVIHRNAQRLLTLVNNLLDFSRLESGRVTSQFEPLDLARYTGELASMFRAATQRAGLELVVDCPPLESPVYVDHDHWAKIVLNLISNALKFTFEGSITVRLRPVDDHAVLSVADTGTGIPDEEQEHLFERFHRVHGARSRTHEGSGIGLALVSELAQLHGGTVEAESTLGSGSTFTVSIPFGRAHLPADQVRDEAAQQSGSPALSGLLTETMRWLTPRSAPDEEEPVVERADAEGPRVLVVDDNADMRDYVASLLRSEHYRVTTASDGLEALERIHDSVPDLVLTDVMMPNLDGFGLLEKLRSEALTTGVPVIMLSARAGEEGTLEGLDAGADDYLAKPFSARELLARVRVNIELDRQRRLRDALERSQQLLGRAERLAKVGSWEIDLAHGSWRASDELLRILDRSRDEFEALGFPAGLEATVHPEDRLATRTALEDAAPGRLISYEARLVRPSGEERLVSVRGEVAEVDGRRPRVLRGSVQDITEQREAERALAAAAAREEAAAREHAIADALQRSLLPQESYDLEHIDVATFYRAGSEGTRVGGDWYDIIELGAGRTAFVVGDVMGRGVHAASVMGQVRSAVRAFAKLELPPSDLLESLDAMVQDMAGEHIVTCVYAVFDASDQTLQIANAGHVPPLLTAPGSSVLQLTTVGPPLGAGFFGVPTESVQLGPNALVAFYTDGLVEQRTRDLDEGIADLADVLAREVLSGSLDRLPERLVDGVEASAGDDDVAILLVKVNEHLYQTAGFRLRGEEEAVAEARRTVTEALREWEVPEETVEDVVLMTSELVTNGLLHGRPPIDLRLRRTDSHIVLEVQDRALYRPRRRRPADDDEHGRGLFIVSALADQWGSRTTGKGKCVWFSKSLSGEVESVGSPTG